jgi:hypothetical protein
MDVDRRKLFAVGGFGALAGLGGIQGPEASFAGGITIRIQRHPDGWMVAVPDWDTYRIGEVPAVKMTPLNEFLAALGKEPNAL